MSRELTDLEMLSELEPVAEANLNRHLSVATEWHPHDYVPWERGRNFAQMGGDDWDPEQSQLSEVAKAAMITNLLTEDNLPSYHRQAAQYFGLDGAWGTWVGRRGEPARHRHSRLSGCDAGSRSGGVGAGADGTHDRGLQSHR